MMQKNLRLILAVALLGGTVLLAVLLVRSDAATRGLQPAQPQNSIAARAGLSPLITSTLYLPIMLNPLGNKSDFIAVNCTNVVGNGDFEAPLPGRPWTGVANTSSALYSDPLIYTTRAHTGTRSGRVGSPSVNSYWNELLQTVQLPRAVITATLVFWRYLDTTETSTTKAYDVFSIGLESDRGIRVASPSQVDNTSNGRSAWVRETLALPNAAAYSGQHLWISFKGTTDSSLPSSLYVDDVQMIACAYQE